MENATKALLVAASVLIVILVIAFGIKIFNSPREVQESALSTGKSIVDQTEKGSYSAISEIQMAHLRQLLSKYVKVGGTTENATLEEVEPLINCIETYNVVEPQNAIILNVRWWDFKNNAAVQLTKLQNVKLNPKAPELSKEDIRNLQQGEKQMSAENLINITKAFEDEIRI